MAFKLRNPSPFTKVSDSDFFTDNMREGFGAGKYGSYSNPSLNSETYSAIDTDFNTPRSYFDERVSSFNDMKDLYERSNVPDINPDGSTGNTTKPRTSTRTPGASRDLESKIKTAESRGNLKRAARLQGRQDRRIERQTEGAKRIEARQAEKTAKVKQRQEDKTKKSIDTSTDGNNLQMKNDSPNNFLGGIAGAVAGRSRGGNLGDGISPQEMMQAIAPNGKFIGFGNIGRAIRGEQSATASQAQQAAGALGNSTLAAAGQTIVPQATITDGVDPILAGAGVVPPGTTDPGNPFQGKTFKIEPASPATMVDPELASAGIQPETTYEPPMQGNQMGNAKPLFNAAVQASAEAIYGSPMQRQMSMPKSGSVTQMSPLNSYENPQTVIDRSHGYVASKAAEAFGKIGEELIKKKKGENEDENE